MTIYRIIFINFIKNQIHFSISLDFRELQDINIIWAKKIRKHTKLDTKSETNPGRADALIRIQPRECPHTICVMPCNRAVNRMRFR